MRVFGENGKAVEGLASFLGQPIVAPEPAPPSKSPEVKPISDLEVQLEQATRERDAALEEARKLRATVETQAKRNRELQDAIEALRRRLRVESSLRAR
jgi:hypothetical protein